MGFLVFTVLLLPAMLLYAAVQALLRPFAGVLVPVLALLNDPVFVYRACQVLLAWNVLVLAVLLIARRRMKRTRGPGWEWEYIHGIQGWRRLGRRLVCLVLTLGPWCEAVPILFFSFVLLFP